MSKHITTPNLTTRLLEHAAMVEPILYGQDLPGFGRHRAETYSLRQLDTNAGHGTYMVEVSA